MDVLSLSPFRTASLRWSLAGRPMATVIAKATFVLAPIESPLAEEQMPVLEDTRYWNDDPSKSAWAASDFAPRKAKTDVLVVGHAFAANGDPVRSLLARVVVGRVDKCLEVYGERVFGADGRLREPSRFTRMPLRWERAAGGPGTSNPLGLRTGPAAVPDAQGLVALPNLCPEGASYDRHRTIDCVGFGPISPPRSHQPPSSRGGYDLPADCDFSMWNVAPPDQQVAGLKDGERIVLQNLHREHSRLATRLAGVHPRALAELRGRASAELPMIADTLWIDTDRGLCTVTWRGQLALDEAEQGGRVVIALEREGESMDFASIQRLSSPAQDRADAKARAESHVTEKGRERPGSEDVTRAARSPTKNTQDVADSEIAEVTAPQDEAAMAMPKVASLPFAAPEQAAAGQDFESPRQRVPTLIHMPGSNESDSSPAWLAPPRAAAAPSIERRSSTPPKPPLVVAPVPESNRTAPATPFNADPRPARPTPPPPPSDVVVSPAIRAGAARAPLVLSGESAALTHARTDVDVLLVDGRVADGSEPESAAARALAEAAPIDAAKLAQAMASAVGSDHRFAAPRVCVAGELTFSFDELEELRAMIAFAAPFAGTSDKLRDAIDLARAATLAPGLEGAGAALAAFAEGIRSAFPDRGYLEASVLRLLLAQRKYARRALAGATWIRAEMKLSGSPGEVPVYLPEALASSLPMFTSIDVRLFADAKLPQDQFERASVALFAITVGRTLPEPPK